MRVICKSQVVALILAYERSSNVHLKYQKHFQCIALALNVGSCECALPQLHFSEGKAALAISSKEKFHLQVKSKVKLIRKNIFACLFSIHNTISLSRHEQVCLMRLRFERYFSHHRAIS